MSIISKRFADELAEKEMRDAYLGAQTRTYLANQIRTLRTERGWSQEDLGRSLRKPQSAISRMEDREYGKFSLQTLFELASAFDCGLIVQFVPYAEFLTRTNNLTPESLHVASFTQESLQPLYAERAQYSQYGYLGAVIPAQNVSRERRFARAIGLTTPAQGLSFDVTFFSQPTQPAEESEWEEGKMLGAWLSQDEGNAPTSDVHSGDLTADSISSGAMLSHYPALIPITRGGHD